MENFDFDCPRFFDFNNVNLDDSKQAEEFFEYTHTHTSYCI